MGIQPRIRMTRSFDTRSHSYLGYVVRLKGMVDGVGQEFILAIGKAAQAKHGFQVGYKIDGLAEPVLDERQELANFYKASKFINNVIEIDNNERQDSS